MRLVKYGMILVMLAAISACAQTPKTVTETVFVSPNIPLQQRPRSPKLTEDTQFYVVTAENYKEFEERFRRENGTLVYIAISIRDYENISLNLAELKRYLEQQESIIVYYETQIMELKNGQSGN